MKIKAESIILFLILILILMFAGYLGYLIYLTIFYKKTVEGYIDENNQKFKRLEGITKICNPADADYDSPECVSVSFYDYDDSLHSVKAILNTGYSVDPNTGFAHKKSTVDETQAEGEAQVLTSGELIPKLDKGNIDIEYHADPAKLPNAKEDLIGYKIQLDKDGKLETVPFSELKGKTLYNEPGNSRFGPSSYVPNYEETVYLSKLTNDTYFEKIPLEDSGSLGFCQNNSLDDIEKKCNSLDNETCPSTECCVLFGGAKCVAGINTGPSKGSNYNDFLVKNRDYYYYKGKCYGNCSKSNGITNVVGVQKYSDYSAVEKETDQKIEDKQPENNDMPWWKNNNWQEKKGITESPSPFPTTSLMNDIIYQ